MKKKLQRKRIKQLQTYQKEEKSSLNISKYITKFLIVVVLTLTTMIILKSNTTWKTIFYKEVFTKNFSFATINQAYQKYFGSPIPFQNLVEKPVTMVFSEKLSYEEESFYKDGVKLTVKDGYLVPNIERGMVVFIGEKEGYFKTVIIQGINGVDTWYGNLENVNVKLYDYVSKGDLVGEAKDNTLYLVFQKEGKNLDYKNYIKG